MLATYANAASPAQIGFILDMLAVIFDDDRDVAQAVLDRNVAAGLLRDRQAVRTAIDALIVKRDAKRAALRAAGRKATETSSTATVSIPEGRYAVEYNGMLGFYYVKNGEGRWEGYQFVKRYHSDELERVTRNESRAVLAAIAADPSAAAHRFASETTRCYVCGRMLTDSTPGGSISKGIGPDCEAKGRGF